MKNEKWTNKQPNKHNKQNESDHKVGSCVKNPCPVIMVVVIIPVVNVVVLVRMTPPINVLLNSLLPKY
jgi:hypothetical protein